MARKRSTVTDDAGEAEARPPRAASAELPSRAPSVAEPARPYVVLARKYRPQTFDDLIGQSAMVQTLSNAFAQGRIAQGYMLTGVRGVGKTTTARILARALNYERDGIDRATIDIREPGRHCIEIMESRHPDVIEMDAASNTGIDNIREVIESARYRPILARTKVFIIDEVHMLSKGAFNALLKTLEEPPEHVKFIFATTEIRRVPVTVLSRCQRFDLRRVDVPELMAHFGRIASSEGATADEDALALIARAAEGSVRDGLSILDQAIAMGSGRVTAAAVRAMLGLADRGRVLDLAEYVFAGDAKASLEALASLHQDGADPAQVLSDLAEAVHAVSRVKATRDDGAADVLSADERRRIAGMAERLSIPLLARAWQMLLKGIDETGRAPDRLAAAEMVLIRLAYTADLPSPDEIIRSLSGAALPPRRGAASPPVEMSAGPNGPLNAASAAPQPATVPIVADGDDGYDETGARFEAEASAGAELADELGLDDPGGEAPAFAARFPSVGSFADVVALVGSRRDAKLKVHLEEHVSLVKCDAVAGSIDLFLLPGAPPELPNELREKLNSWTGRRWIVVVSRKAGEPTLGEVRRKRESAEREELLRHPAVAAVLAAFPGATMTVRELRRITGEAVSGGPGDAETETGTG